jgi:hypothetical protein
MSRLFCRVWSLPLEKIGLMIHSILVKRVFEDQDSATDGVFNIPAHIALNYWREFAQ